MGGPKEADAVLRALGRRHHCPHLLHHRRRCTLCPPPPAIKIYPEGLAIGVSIAIGAGVGISVYIFKKLRARIRAKSPESAAPTTTTVENGAPEPVVVRHEDSGEIPQSSWSKRTKAAMSVLLKGGTQMRQAEAAAVELEQAEKPFVPLLILSALVVAFAHGANDVGNTCGPLAAVFEVSMQGRIAATPDVPYGILAVGTGGFVVGIAALGARTIETVGNKITKLTPSKSFAVQIGAAVAVLSSTVLGLAVSTSHCLVGSVVGVGIAAKLTKSGEGLNTKILVKIFIGWGVTIPLAMFVSMICYWIIAPSYTYPDSFNATNASLYNVSCT